MSGNKLAQRERDTIFDFFTDPFSDSPGIFSGRMFGRGPLGRRFFRDGLDSGILEELDEMMSRPLRTIRRMRGIMEDEDFRMNVTGAVDIREEEGKYIVEMDIPGIEPEKIDVEVSPSFMLVKWHGNFETPAGEESGKPGGDGDKEKTVAPVEEGRRWIRKERSFSLFSQRVAFPARVDSDQAKAECKNGVLTVTVPLAEQKSGKKIPVVTA